MQTKQFGNTIILRLDRGDEIISCLTALYEQYPIKLASITGIGATNEAKVGLFDITTKKYYATTTLSTMAGKPYLHLHATLCDKDHRAWGGHLNSAIISATFEGIITLIDGTVDRQFDPEIGLNLWSFDTT